MRHPLARALHGAGLDAAEVAARLEVDPKTVERWCAGRLPFPRSRDALVALTGWSESELWPQLTRPAVCAPAGDEIRVVYPQRSAVPTDAWHRLFARARIEIGIAAYSGLFLVEDAVIQRTLRDQAHAGVRVRIALGDPAGRHVAQRGSDEGINDTMAARIHNALALCRRLARTPGVQLRLHDTTLYNSIYRSDDELLVNTHTYGCSASHAPVLHLCRSDDHGLAATYLDSFERIWTSAEAV